MYWAAARLEFVVPATSAILIRTPLASPVTANSANASRSDDSTELCPCWSCRKRRSPVIFRLCPMTFAGESPSDRWIGAPRRCQKPTKVLLRREASSLNRQPAQSQFTVTRSVPASIRGAGDQEAASRRRAQTWSLLASRGPAGRSERREPRSGRRQELVALRYRKIHGFGNQFKIPSSFFG